MYFRKKPENIILIVADSLCYDTVYRNKEIGMSYVSENALQFSNAYSAGCWTLPATSSIFTGMLPHEHGADTFSRKLNSSIPTLAEILKQAGYETIEITANNVVTEIFGVNRGFERVIKIWENMEPEKLMLYFMMAILSKKRLRNSILSLNTFNKKLLNDIKASYCWFQSSHRLIFEKSLAMISLNRIKKRPTFLFINLMETHFPYHIEDHFKLDSDNYYQKAKELLGMFHFVNQSYLTDDKYLHESNYLKKLQSRQVTSWQRIRKDVDDFIKELHQDNNNLIIFTSDHGDNFGDSGYQYHFANVTNAGTRVPLFWLGDESARLAYTHDVSTKDIFYSVLDKCKIHSYRSHNIFDESALSVPISESYWYDKNGKTLGKYRNDKFSFIEQDVKYVYEAGHWKAGRINRTEEPDYNDLNKGLDPITEFIVDNERREYIVNSFHNFLSFKITRR